MKKTRFVMSGITVALVAVFAGVFLAACTTSMSKATVTLEYQSVAYNGGEHRPAVTVTYKGKEVDKSKYTVNYVDNVKAGTVRVQVTGISSSGWKGEVTKPFVIEKASLEGAVINLYDTSYSYTGFPREPSVQSVTKESFLGIDAVTETVGVIDRGEYTISYSNNIDKGQATVTVTAKTDSNWQGSVSRNFTIY